MTAEIFGLACLAALNPKLLAADLIFMSNRRPRVMFACFLLGGMGMALGIGLLDVLVLQASAIEAEALSSAGLDLALGIPLLALGILLLTEHLPGLSLPAAAKRPGKVNAWAQHVLREPRPGLVMAIGLVAGTPGASYITALHLLVTGKSPVAEQVVAVAAFTVIEFSLVIVPFAALAANPEGTERAVKRFRDWLLTHARQILGAVALVVGGYMTISGLVRLA